MQRPPAESLILTSELHRPHIQPRISSNSGKEDQPAYKPVEGIIWDSGYDLKVGLSFFKCNASILDGREGTPDTLSSDSMYQISFSGSAMFQCAIVACPCCLKSLPRRRKTYLQSAIIMKKKPPRYPPRLSIPK